jgi:hypothetical protein
MGFPIGRRTKSMLPTPPLTAAATGTLHALLLLLLLLGGCPGVYAVVRFGAPPSFAFRRLQLSSLPRWFGIHHHDHPPMDVTGAHLHEFIHCRHACVRCVLCAPTSKGLTGTPHHAHTERAGVIHGWMIQLAQVPSRLHYFWLALALGT